MDITQVAGQTVALPSADPAPPSDNRLVTPELLFLNAATTYRMGAAFSGTANPTAVWQQMIDNMPAAMLYYRELEEKDDDVGAAIAEMKLSVLKRTWQIQPADDSAQAQDAAEFIRTNIANLPDWRNTLDNLLDAPFYGYTVGEQIFDTTMGQANLLDIMDCPQELFAFGDWSQPQVGPLRLKTYATASAGVFVPESKFIVYTSRKRHGNRMGRPLLRSVYWPSWIKRNDLRFWLRLAERGPGTAVVTHSDNATDDEKNKAIAAAQALIEQVAVAVPESFKVITELLQGTRTADPKTYESLYNMLEAKIYRRIVGSTLTSHGSDGGKGTQALGNVHAETKEDRSVELALQTDAVINQQLVRNLVLWNFGPDCPMPRYATDVADQVDQGKLVTVADTVQQMGLPIPKKWVYTTFGIPVPEEGEETLVRPAAPAPPIATPAGPPDRPQFSALQQSQVDKDRAAVDKLFAQFRTDALAEAGKRIRSLAEGVKRSGAGPQ